MQELRFNPAVKEKFTSYPEHAREKLLYLRNLIIETATENGVVKLEETLKMGRTKLSDEEGKHHQNGLESKSTQSVRHVF